MFVFNEYIISFYLTVFLATFIHWLNYGFCNDHSLLHSLYIVGYCVQLHF